MCMCGAEVRSRNVNRPPSFAALFLASDFFPLLGAQWPDPDDPDDEKKGTRPPRPIEAQNYAKDAETCRDRVQCVILFVLGSALGAGSPVYSSLHQNPTAFCALHVFCCPPWQGSELFRQKSQALFFAFIESDRMNSRNLTKRFLIRSRNDAKGWDSWSRLALTTLEIPIFVSS